jgi:GH15 family glucan-1,4-alpha-glucosidase
LIGNCTVGALIDARAKIVWGCWPRFDGDPVFCSLLRNTDDYGFSAVELADCERTEQHYLENTAILVTRLLRSPGWCASKSPTSRRASASTAACSGR